MNKNRHPAKQEIAKRREAEWTRGRSNRVPAERECEQASASSREATLARCRWPTSIAVALSEMHINPAGLHSGGAQANMEAGVPPCGNERCELRNKPAPIQGARALGKSVYG